MANVLGVDLGKQGAACLLGEDERIIWKKKTPLIKAGIKNGEKVGKDDYDIPGMAAILVEAKAPGPLKVIVEKAQPMPMLGSLAQYHRGLSFGLWQGLLVGLGISYEAVRPQAWQRVMLVGLSGDTKQSSVIAAQRIWPTEDWRSSERARIADNGFTDAALLGLFGLRIMKGRQ